jgi:hypothetical protein
MPGIRLRHPDYANALVTVPIPHRPLRPPHLCPTCNLTHAVKTYHLRLDDQGTVIVSATIYEWLKEVGLAGFELVNEVKNPPPIRLELNGHAQVFDIKEIR